jgi:hypothetical protein
MKLTISLVYKYLIHYFSCIQFDRLIDSFVQNGNTLKTHNFISILSNLSHFQTISNVLLTNK